MHQPIMASKPPPSRLPEEGSRRVLVFATAKGKKLAQKQAQWGEVFSEAAAECSKAEKTTLLSLFLRLIAKLVAQGVIAEARLCLTCRYFTPNAHKDAATPHHCELVDLPLSPAHLRIDCPDQEPTTEREIEHRLQEMKKKSLA